MSDSFAQEEYFALVKAVAESDQRQLTIKGWGVTLSLVALGLGFQYRAYGFFFIAAVSGLAFWMIEHAAKRHQIRHYVRMRQIEVARYQEAPDELRQYSSPRIDWSWQRAGSILEGNSESLSEPVVLRAKHRTYAIAGLLPHVAFPHAVSVAVGALLFILGYCGELPDFELGAPPSKSAKG